MKNKKQKKSATDDLIDALFSNEISNEKPGEGWYSTWDIAKMYGLSRSHAMKKTTQYVKEGKIEVKRFRVRIDNAYRIVPYYKAIK